MLQTKEFDTDQEYSFLLRGNTPNTLIDAATPLLGLSLRVRKLEACESINQIYQQVIDEIQTIEAELVEKGYDQATVMAYRYLLCAFLDEAVLGTKWGTDTVWSQQSMLSRFHNETWGGEKFFSILERLTGEPERFKELLAFAYHCLILGFEGKYHVLASGSGEREKVITDLYSLLNDTDETEVKNRSLIGKMSGKVINTKFKMNRQLPVWSVWLGFVLLWGGMFLGYSSLLQVKSVDVLSQLNQILH